MISLCVLSGEPAARLRPALDPWRSVVDEVVIAADDRVGPDDLAAYREMADTVEMVRFVRSERHFAQMHAACRGDWIVRIDSDEAPSQALLDAVPELCSSKTAAQWWIPRRWVSEDATGWLDEVPWWPDPQLRIVRNDERLRFAGVQHSTADVVEPSLIRAAPLNHVVLATVPRERRKAKTEDYEEARPGLEAPGGLPMDSFYLPHRYVTRPPAPLPAEDRPHLDPLLRAYGVEPRPALVLHERDLRMQPGRARPVLCTLRNTTASTWPAHGDVRAAAKWHHADGTVTENPRTELPVDVAPGETLDLLVTLLPPPGARELELDVVHEHVAWLGVGLRVPVSI